MKKIISFFCLISIITPYQFSFADDSERQSVEISGKNVGCDGILSERCGWGDFGTGNVGGGDSGSGSMGGGGGGAVDPAVAYLVNASKKQRDVRCATGVMPSTTLATSRSEEETRYLAAADIQNKINRQDWFKSIFQNDIIGFFIRRADKLAVRIIYADGGSEEWYVTTYFNSVSVTTAVPGTLVYGSGKIEPSPNCPKYG